MGRLEGYQIVKLCKFCGFLAETEQSHTEDRPGMSVDSFTSWSEANKGSTLGLPISLLDAPFIKAATKVYMNERCIYGVDTEELLTWLVEVGCISQEDKDLVLARTTLKLMGG